MIERFAFSSDGLPQDQAFDLYRRLYSGGADVARAPGPFRADMTAWRLDRLIVFDRRLSGVTHQRLAPRVQSTGFSHFTVTLVIAGELVGTANSGFERVGPGQIVLQDMRRPAQHHVASVHQITVSVARDLIEAAAGSANGLHGRIVEVSEAGLLADYMTSLTRRAADLPMGASSAVSRAFVDLLSLALMTTGGGGRAGSAREEFARREAIQRFIEQNLSDPDLDAATIVAGTGVSRTVLYRAMAAHGGVARFIATQRIARVRTRLDSDPTVTLAELADLYCLSSASRLSKRFKETFDVSPSDYRRLIADPDRATEALKQRWAAWMVEIR